MPTRIISVRCQAEPRTSSSILQTAPASNPSSIVLGRYTARAQIIERSPGPDGFGCVGASPPLAIIGSIIPSGQRRARRSGPRRQPRIHPRTSALRTHSKGQPCLSPAPVNQAPGPPGWQRDRQRRLCGLRRYTCSCGAFPRTITIRSRRRRNRPGRTASSRDDFVDLSVRGEPSSNSVGRRSWSFRSFTRTSRSCGGALTLLPGLADAHLVGAGPAVRDQLLPAAAAYGSSAAPEGRLPIVGSFDRNPLGSRLCTRTCDSCGARDLPPNLGGAATRRSAPDQR